jgi:hypothetical protein
MTPSPANLKIYHIVHVDRLPSILADGFLFSDAWMASREGSGTTVGMGHIKERRLSKELASHIGLTVGQCVPFYFCPPSVMLYIIYQGNHADLAYKGGQTPIIHLEADLNAAIAWATENGKRWAFTTQNAGSSYFDDYVDINQLSQINWEAVAARDWRANREAKQAEFLMEECFPWELFKVIGVHNQTVYSQVQQALYRQAHCPAIAVKHDWYY